MRNRGERAGANASFWERTAQKFSTTPLQQDIRRFGLLLIF